MVRSLVEALECEALGQKNYKCLEVILENLS